MKKEPTIVFGRVIIDKLHMFFGQRHPIACVVCDYWANEEDDSATTVNHYRGIFEVSFKDLRDTSKWEVLDQFVDLNRSIRKQLKEIEEKYFKDQVKKGEI